MAWNTYFQAAQLFTQSDAYQEGYLVDGVVRDIPLGRLFRTLEIHCQSTNNMDVIHGVALAPMPAFREFWTLTIKEFYKWGKVTPGVCFTIFRIWSNYRGPHVTVSNAVSHKNIPNLPNNAPEIL